MDWLDHSASLYLGPLLPIREEAMNTQQTVRKPRISGTVTPERFAKLTQHLRVNGKPVENVLEMLQSEKRSERFRDLIKTGAESTS